MRKLNKNIEDKAKKLNQWILDQDVIQEFQKYEKMIANHPYLKQLEEELKALQKQIVHYKHNGIPSKQLIQTYQEKKKAFDENPLVHNYLTLKQEVNDLLVQIQDNINQQLNKKVD